MNASLQHIVTSKIGERVSVFVVINKPSGPDDKPFDGPWVVDVEPEEVIKRFSGWEPDAKNMVKVRDKDSAVLRQIDIFVAPAHREAESLGDARDKAGPTLCTRNGRFVG